MDSIFLELSLIIIIATIIAGFMHAARQPIIIGHIITGLIVGPQLLNIAHSTELFDIFAQIGIALLLFIIGLNLRPAVIKEVGRVALVTGLGQIIFTTVIGFFIGRGLGFDTTTSAYIAIALTFSSTIIVMKLLSDKKDLGRLYGKISIGFLLVQDIVATLILIIVSSVTGETNIPIMLLATLLEGLALVALLLATVTFGLPKLTGFFARSPEFLFLFAISWGLGIASLFQVVGFSIEIGALFAGVAMATSPYTYEISSRLRPLRDFFIVLFFILLGSRLSFDHIGVVIAPAILFSLFVIIGNPLIIMILMRILGYNKKTGFKAGLTVAQISEFSLILIVLANRHGQINDDAVTLVTVVGLITIAVSTYMIIYANVLYGLLSPYLGIFEKRSSISEQKNDENYEAILFGYHHVGEDLIHSFKQLKSSFLVVDYNPEVIEGLTNSGIDCLYGDANDNEFLSELNLAKTKLIISTMSDFEANLILTKQVRHVSKHAIVIVKSDLIEDAAALYDAGATYVMMPHYISTNHTSELIHRNGFDLSEFIKERDKHLRYIKKRRDSLLLGLEKGKKGYPRSKQA